MADGVFVIIQYLQMMMGFIMSRLTKKITYSLKNRGYQHNGQNRDDLDINAAIKLIRSPQVQELVNKGGVLGFYGHQIRELLGLNPPETAVIDGREIRIEPAVKTTLLEVDKDGNVTHQQYFFENEAGEHAFRQYKAGIGGFSSAFYSPYQNGKRVPLSFHGFDFVLRPNYDSNRGNGMFDSLDGSSTNIYQKQALEQSVLTMYDHIMQSNVNYAMSDFHESRAIAAETALQRELALKEKRKQRAIANKQSKLDMMVSQMLDSVSLDEYLAHSDKFLSVQLDDVELEQPTKEKSVTVKDKLFNLFG